MAEISLEHDGLIMAEPQCECDSKDCKKRNDCVIQVTLDGHFFPLLSMRTGDQTKTYPSCYGDCTIVCISYRGDKKLDGQDDYDG